MNKNYFYAILLQRKLSLKCFGKVFYTPCKPLRVPKFSRLSNKSEVRVCLKRWRSSLNRRTCLADVWKHFKYWLNSSNPAIKYWTYFPKDCWPRMTRRAMQWTQIAYFKKVYRLSVRVLFTNTRTCWWHNMNLKLFIKHSALLRAASCFIKNSRLLCSHRVRVFVNKPLTSVSNP